jgi:hypothetical protein
MKTQIHLLTVLSAVAMTASVQAGVTEADGLGSSWLGSPQWMSVTSPTLGTSAENGFGSAGTTGSSGGLGGLGQSFVNSTAGTLSSIQLSMGGSSGHSFNIFLYDLGSAGSYTPATSATFTPGSLTDLLSPTASFTYGGGASGGQSVVQLSFSGSDAPSLTAGELYGFTIEPTVSGTQPSLYRGGTTSFTLGQAYRYAQFSSGNYGAINGAIRDFDMAVTVNAVPEPSSIALIGLGLAGLVIRSRKS